MPESQNARITCSCSDSLLNARNSPIFWSCSASFVNPIFLLSSSSTHYQWFASFPGDNYWSARTVVVRCNYFGHVFRFWLMPIKVAAHFPCFLVAVSTEPVSCQVHACYLHDVVQHVSITVHACFTNVSCTHFFLQSSKPALLLCVQLI